MEDYEGYYLLFYNELILKYGEPLVKRGAYKSAGILMISAMFKHVPNNASFDQEIGILQDVGNNINKPQIKNDWSDRQKNFRNNRYSEIVRENKDEQILNNKKDNSTQDKISSVEALGIITAGMLDKTFTSGQTVGDLVKDLYKLYVYQYKLYIHNPQHPIFINAVLDYSVNEQVSHKQNHPPQASNTKKGCLGVLFILLSIFLLILAG